MMSEKRCGTCKHWGCDDDGPTDRTYREPHGEFRQCAAIPHDENYDYSLVAVVQDGSGYWGALKTATAFGCVLWEPA